MVYDFVVKHLSLDAFGYKHKMETGKKKKKRRKKRRLCSVAHGCDEGFDLHFTVIALLKCSMREGLYPWRSLYNEF